MMQTANHHKQTPISKIPKEWGVVRLRDQNVVELIIGQSPPSSTYNEKGEGLPFLQGKLEFGEIYPSPTIYCSNPIKIAEPNDILLSVRAPVGEVNIAPFRCCIGRGLSAIRAKQDKFNHLFLFYYLKLNGKKFEALSAGSTFKAIRKQEIENYSVPRPPLPEQRRIAEILSTVYQAIQRVDEAIARTERLKRGLMQELLTKGIGHKEFKFNKELGCEIPREWNVVGLGDKNIAELIMGQSPPSSTYNKRGEGLPFLQGKMEFGEIYPSPTIYCSNPVKTAESNDILLSVRAPVGDVNIAPFECCIGRGVSTIRVKQSKIHHLFLFYYLKFNGKKFEALSAGSTFKAIRRQEIENYRVPLPPILEQQKIAEILSTVDKKLELERKRKEKLERLKKGLMNDLLTGKRRVKL